MGVMRLLSQVVIVVEKGYRKNAGEWARVHLGLTALLA